jgi:tetratricopeptide (TPR) repeat protein
MSEQPSFPTAHEQRVVRVFVSSTFRDMKAERDHLVKFIFPQLRKLCESRGVTWGEVDLRWGITEQESERGKVLRLCLEEIDRCRPYFIGLLGDYYGTLAKQVAPDLKPKDSWPEDHAERSVTELEIFHGVLANPQMADRAFFYFRDPAYILSLPPEQQRAFTNPDLTAKVKLAALKKRIRQRYRNKLLKYPPRENYANPEALGQLVLEDFTCLIDELFPEDQQPDPLDREAADHEAFAESRARVYIGRQEYFDRLDAHVGSKAPPLVVLGESGIGKSALLANWFLEYRKNHPDDFALIHFIGGTPDSTDPIRLLRRIMLELKRRFPNQLPDNVPVQLEKIREEFPQWLARVAASGRIILILDGLNQLEDRDATPELGWLPMVFPPNCRVILSTLPGRSLDATRRRQWPEMIVQPLTVPERKELLQKFLAQYSRRLSPARVERITSAEQIANPLFLRAMLDELRQFGEHERLEERIEHYLAAHDPKNLYERILERWEQDYSAGQDLVRQSLSLIWAARRGLSEAELLDLLGKDSRPLPRTMWTFFYLAAETNLVQRSGLLNFFHGYLREAVRDRYLPAEPDERGVHARLAMYFADSCIFPRGPDELPWQLVHAKEWTALFTCLKDLRLMSAIFQLDRLDLELYWQQVEANSTLRMVEAYQPVVQHLAEHVEHAENLGILFLETGNYDLAMQVYSFLFDHTSHVYDRPGMSNALGNKAAVLIYEGRLDEALELLEKQKQIVGELNDSKALGRLLGNQGNVFRLKGQDETAMSLFRQAGEIARQIGLTADTARSFNAQAVVLRRQGQLNASLAMLEEAEKIAREVGDSHLIADVLGNRGNILNDMGRREQALSCLQEQERRCRQIGDRERLQRCLGNQARFMTDSGQLDRAEELLNEQERICREIGARWSLSLCLLRQADLHMQRRAFDRALTTTREAAEICRQLGDKKGLAEALNNHACVLGQVFGAPLEAAPMAMEALHLMAELGMPFKNSVLQNLAAIEKALEDTGISLFRNGQHKDALTVFTEQEKICRATAKHDRLHLCLGRLANVRASLGELDTAQKLHEEQELICRRLGDQMGLQASLGDQALIFRELGDHISALRLLQEQETICSRSGFDSHLAISLGNQALIHTDLGNTAKAMQLRKKQEYICRRTKDVEGLAISLASQVDLMIRMGNCTRIAIRAAIEACDMAERNGFTQLAGQIRSFLSHVRDSL